MNKENCFSYYDEKLFECQQCRIKDACRMVKGVKNFEDQLKILLTQGRYSLAELKDMFWKPTPVLKNTVKKLGAHREILYQLKGGKPNANY